MDCTSARSLFNTYLDGELSGSLAAELAAHKLQCAPCRRELALLEVSGHVLSTDTATPGLDAEFTERLIACATTPPRRSWRQWRTMAAVAAPLAAAACLLFVFSHGVDEPAPGDGHPTPRVLDAVERMTTPQEMLEQVEKARINHPDSAELEALEAALRAKIDDIAGNTEEQAKLLESFGKMTIMEILESMPLNSPQESAPLETAPLDTTPPGDGPPDDPAAAGATGDEHDPPAAES